MIKVYFSPQVSDRKIEYGFNGETLTVKIGDTEDVFDLSSLPDGELNMEEPIESTLPVNPIISARRIDGILHLELLNWIESNAPYESRFPEWVELPLPKAAEDGGEKTASAPTSIPWRTKAEIDAEREAAIAAEQERAERRARIKAAFNNSLLESGGVDLRDVLRDMAMEMGLIN